MIRRTHCRRAEKNYKHGSVWKRILKWKMASNMVSPMFYHKNEEKREKELQLQTFA